MLPLEKNRVRLDDDEDEDENKVWFLQIWFGLVRFGGTGVFSGELVLFFEAAGAAGAGSCDWSR